MPDAPAVPLSLNHLPTVAGLAVPWITPTLPDGRHLFGKVDASRLRAALDKYLCSICGKPLDERIVFAMRDVDLRRLLSPEPGMHPACAHYSALACPMLGGRMARYGRAVGVAAEVGIPLGDPGNARAGHAADRYHLVWVNSYRVVTDPATDLPSAQVMPWQILRSRPIVRQEGA
ncbi:hypothetical protein [Micromonospora sp. NPDC047730]|uniref:hypothetical protein n=1 Tax=Micromonospora sp. NPDC047730 TaxID=3364253 RepID=UPI0037101750